MSGYVSAIVGSTGLVGSHILSTLVTFPTTAVVHSIARRAPDTSSPKVLAQTSPDTTTWPATLSTLAPPPSIFFSGLATTRAAAGGFANQRKIDHDLNVDLAKAAKASGVKVYVLISAGGANAKSSIPYTKMKGETEEEVKALGFDHTIIVRPGLIVGERSESRPAEFALRKIAGAAGMLGNGFKDFWAQDAEVIARAAVAAGMKAVAGKETVPKVWELGQADIVRLGRTEWEAYTTRL